MDKLTGRANPTILFNTLEPLLVAHTVLASSEPTTM
jgi:hypothetical protein